MNDFSENQSTNNLNSSKADKSIKKPYVFEINKVNKSPNFEKAKFQDALNKKDQFIVNNNKKKKKNKFKLKLNQKLLKRFKFRKPGSIKKNNNNIGRWSLNEKKQFLEACLKYKNNWKKVNLI